LEKQKNNALCSVDVFSEASTTSSKEQVLATRRIITDQIKSQKKWQVQYEISGSLGGENCVCDLLDYNTV
jgi:hypothetical protein